MLGKGCDEAGFGAFILGGQDRGMVSEGAIGPQGKASNELAHKMHERRTGHIGYHLDL